MHLFVSYKRGHTLSTDVIAEFESLAKTYDHTVFYDTTIEAGDEWDARLYHELAICDAAVVLVCQEAADSRWCRREVDMLLWRRSLGSRLKVIPVLLEALPPTSRQSKCEVPVEERLGQLSRLSKLEAIDAEIVGYTPTQLGNAILGVLPAAVAPHHDHVAVWVRNLEDLLSLTNERHWYKAALALGIPEELASQAKISGDPRFLAHQLLGRPLDDGTIRAIDGLTRVLPTGKGAEIARMVAPNWVDMSASLPLAMHREGHQITAAINGAFTETAEHYIKRAMCVPAWGPPIVAVSCAAGEDAYDEILRECELAVDHLITDGIDTDPNGIAKQQRSSGPDDRTFLVINRDGAPMSLVAAVALEVRRRFPWLVVVLLVGYEVTDQQAAVGWTLADSELLRPVLSEPEDWHGRKRARKLLTMTEGR